MNRRAFFAAIGLAGVALAQEAEEGKKKGGKPDRLSGRVMSVDKNAMTVEMHTNANPNVKRMIKWNADTKFTQGDKPASADDLKEGVRIVAVGKFEGPNLHATAINLPPRP